MKEGEGSAPDRTGLNGYQLTDIDVFHLCATDGEGGGLRKGGAQWLLLEAATLKIGRRLGNVDHMDGTLCVT